MDRITVFAAVLFISSFFSHHVSAQDVLGCGGFVKAEVEINFSLVEVKLYTKQGSLKYQTDCAPNNGYYMIPIYDKGDYVLKVEPPPGWTFEPESVALHIDGSTDPCSLGEDINFQFTGFGVIGKVVSKGSDVGPNGVTLTLKKKGSGEVVKETITQNKGGFTLERVLPGEYTIEASHPRWKFEKSVADVMVSKETGHAGSSITVAGYDVTGKVSSDGEPIKGVNFVLFSENIKSKEVSHCDKTDVPGLTAYPSSIQLCHVTSQEDGAFVFPALPIGQYTLVPFYKGEHITFDVEPKSMDFTVHHSSVELEKTFQVEGFSVSGRVLDSQEGKGVPGAMIYLNLKQQTVTNGDGTYHLENMKTGTYSLDVKSDNIFFDVTTVKITPNTPHLPDIVASRFNLCGTVRIDKMPDQLGQVKGDREVKLQAEDDDVSVRLLRTDTNGKFCAEVEPGTYILKAVISDTEVKAGLHLAPEQHEATVTKAPVFDVLFSQFRASVSGSVTCLASCGVLRLSLEPAARADGKQIIEAPEMPDNAALNFEFIDVMPGKYKVTLLNEDWCWEEKSKVVEVTNENLSGVDFYQSGFSLTCSLSHNVKLNFEHEKKKRKGSFDLKKGVNKFCLNEPGIYKITTESCHMFEQEVYHYDTARQSLLMLSAVRHLVEGSITTQELVTDIVVTIKSSVEGEKPTVIGPLRSEKEPQEVKADDKEGGKGDKKKDAKVKEEKPKGPFTYKFTYMARSGEKIEVTASSAELLFYPGTAEAVIIGDTCPGEMVKLEGRRGVFIAGQITPALVAVKITITPLDGKDTTITLETDDKGKYKVGPLHSHTEYEVGAEKEGYVLTAVNNKQGHFSAHKLAEINVQVLTENEEPLSSVLLSLSGGMQYRSNKLTQANGDMRFTSLSPGAYFLRPMMKEYSFEPASQMVQVEEGKTVNIKIKGTRVAFSCYGSVTSLNGEPEPGVYVEAVGREDCDKFQEESKTESDGSYRIRGLKPNCFYHIRLKTGDVNHHIERAAPKSVSVKVEGSDLENINIIAFRRMNQLDLSGNVVTPNEFLSSLKVHLCREDNPDTPIHTVSLGPTSFFYLPSLTMDQQMYLVRLDTTLSRRSYEFTLPEISFTANISYRHFTFKFEPKRKTVEQELNQSSFLVLPLALLVGLIGYHYQKILPFMGQLISQAQVTLNRQMAPGQAESSAPSVDELAHEIMITKKKPKIRRA